MAGHSKWKTIKRAKAATDSKRSAVFTKLIREITVAAKTGGGDPAGNPRLRLAIDTARSSSMPKDNIERAVLKGTGDLEGVDYQEIMYEAYGPGGVALMIQTLTDNPTRTVADVRHKLSRAGGNLGATNSVAWMFDRKGQIYLDVAGREEEATMELARGMDPRTAASEQIVNRASAAGCGPKLFASHGRFGSSCAVALQNFIQIMKKMDMPSGLSQLFQNRISWLPF